MNINNTYKSAIHKETIQQFYLVTNHGGSRFISSSLSWYLLSSYRMAWPACAAEDRLPVVLELLALQSCPGDRCSPGDERGEGMREEREGREGGGKRAERWRQGRGERREQQQQQQQQQKNILQCNITSTMI